MLDPYEGFVIQKKDNSKRLMMGDLAVLILIVIGVGVWFAISLEAKNKALEA